jgi:anhydro-N-acetylmuramic acid kinase
MERYQSEYTVVGVMSGSSLDGVDLALCRFLKTASWSFAMIRSDVIPYPEEWKQKLKDAPSMSGHELIHTHAQYGRYLGTLVKEFLHQGNEKINFISSHGHTIFHQPQKGFTLQIGDGAALAAEAGLPVVCDFRTADIALGGQGAPLVPVGDRLLFDEYGFCLNIGGIANISAEVNGKRIAYDICPANQLLNNLAANLGAEYDKDGALARKGDLNPELIQRLNSFGYYQKNFPKSLGNENVAEYFFPLLRESSCSIEDKLRTCTEHIAQQIADAVNEENSLVKNILVTGGGAFNKFLIELLKEKTHHRIVLPENNIIKFKEAIVFAFLGVLRMRNEVNVLKSVTGASRDSVSGAVYHP